MLYEFGPFCLDASKRALLRDGSPIAISPKVFDLLLVLIQTRRKPIDKSQLMRLLWPDTNVEEANLPQNIWVLRDLLGEGEGQRRYILTLPKFGYKFIADVVERPVQAEARVSRKKIFLPGLAFALAVALSGGWAAWRYWPSPPPPPVVTQLTVDVGWTGTPVLSRDGKLLVYASDRADGNADIWVKHMSGGPASRLTRHPAIDRFPDISPDDTLIAFRSHRDDGGIYTVPVLGGEERKIADGGYSPRFSPDGAWIAYAAMNNTGSSSIYVVPSAGGVPRKVESQARNAGCPIWTPEGEHLLFVATGKAGEKHDWWVAPFDASSKGRPDIKTGAADALLREGVMMNSYSCPVDWIGHRVAYVSRKNNVAHLWLTPISPVEWTVQGQAEQALTWPALYGARVAGTPKTGPLLVFADENPSTQIWSVPLDSNRGKPLGPLKQLTQDASLHMGLAGTLPRLSLDGDKLAFASARLGNSDVWLKDLKTGVEHALASSALAEDKPLITADGSKVAFMVSEANKSVIYIRHTSSHHVQKICADCGIPKDWASDGTKILYLADKALSVLDVASGTTEEILRDPKNVPLEATFSPDGNWIALVVDRIGEDRYQGFVVPFDGSLADEPKWIPITREYFDLSLHWSPNGNLLYFFSKRDQFRCIWAQNLHRDTKQPIGEAFGVYHFHKYQPYPWIGSWISVARDKLAVTLSTSSSNIFIAELGGNL